jgi:uncharacterized protein (DUF302 family)
MNRQTLLLPVLAVLAVLATACQETTELAQPAQTAEFDSGLVTVESNLAFEETFDRLQAALEANENLRILTTVDHQANAAGVGHSLPPTRLILFGNPALGTPLMQGSRTTAIDLPQKMLVWQDQDGRVFLTYNDPLYLRQRHGLEGGDEILTTMSNALRTLANVATR